MARAAFVLDFFGCFFLGFLEGLSATSSVVGPVSETFCFLLGGSKEDSGSASSAISGSTMLALYCWEIAKGFAVGGVAVVFRTLTKRITNQRQGFQLVEPIALNIKKIVEDLDSRVVLIVYTVCTASLRKFLQS